MTSDIRSQYAKDNTEEFDTTTTNGVTSAKGAKFCPGVPDEANLDPKGWPICPECERVVQSPTGRHKPNPNKI